MIYRFNSSIAPLIYADQFIQLSSSLVSKYIYGLGERRSSLLLSAEWKTYTIWTEEADGVRVRRRKGREKGRKGENVEVVCCCQQNGRPIPSGQRKLMVSG